MATRSGGVRTLRATLPIAGAVLGSALMLGPTAGGVAAVGTAGPGASEPELEPIPEVPGPPIRSEVDLQRIEAELDRLGSPWTYVCGDPDATEYVVVLGRTAPNEMRARGPAADAGPLVEWSDPCAGKSIVVGRGG